MRQIKLCEPIGRDSQLLGRQQEPVASGLSNRAVLLPPPRVDVQWPWQQGEPAAVSQLSYQQNVFHQTCFRKPAELFENVPPQKDTLIAERQPSAADAESIAGFQKPKRQSGCVNLLAENSPRKITRMQCEFHLPRRVRVEPAVRVKKQQRVSRCHFRSEILLLRSAAW